MTNFSGFLRQITAMSLRSQFLWKTKVTRCTYLILETEIVGKKIKIRRKRNKKRKRGKKKMRRKKRKNSTSLDKRDRMTKCFRLKAAFGGYLALLSTQSRIYFRIRSKF